MLKINVLPHYWQIEMFPYIGWSMKYLYVRIKWQKWFQEEDLNHWIREFDSIFFINLMSLFIKDMCYFSRLKHANQPWDTVLLQELLMDLECLTSNRVSNRGDVHYLGYLYLHGNSNDQPMQNLVSKPPCCWWLIWSLQNDAKIPEKWLKPWYMGTHLRVYSTRAFRWIPAWQGLNGFQKIFASLCCGWKKPRHWKG